MNLTFSKIRMIVAMLLATSSAFADGNPEQSLQPVRLIEMKAEYYPEDTYHLGYYEKKDHSIDSFFYEGNDHSKINFSFNEIQAGVAIIQTTHGETVYDLVRAKMTKKPGEERYSVKLSYLRNGVTNSRRYIEIELYFIKSRNQYELGNEYGVVSRAYVTTNYWGNIAVGIESIITQK